MYQLVDGAKPRTVDHTTKSRQTRTGSEERKLFLARCRPLYTSSPDSNSSIKACPAMSSGGSSFYVTPGQYRYLRACMVCSIVQPQQVSAPSFFVPALEKKHERKKKRLTWNDRNSSKKAAPTARMQYTCGTTRRRSKTARRPSLRVSWRCGSRSSRGCQSGKGSMAS